MPNLITHTIFAQEAANGLENSDVLQGRMHLFGVGANGPDFLFFEGLSLRPGSKQAPIRKYGSRFHHGHVNNFYQSALRSIRQEKDPLIKADMTAYVLGHLCHWALDSVCHPYIFGRTGAYEAASSTRHHTLESLLDAVMLKVKKGETIQEYYYPSIAECSLEEARAVARIYVPAIEEVFQEKIAPHLIKDCLDDWAADQRLMYDYTGKKRHHLRKIEKVLLMENLMSGMIVPAYVDDNWDFMNLLHKEWMHPCDASITSTESLFDLYDRALIRAKRAMNLFMAALENPGLGPEFLDYLGDRGYDTGLDTDTPMKNFDIIDFKY